MKARLLLPSAYAVLVSGALAWTFTHAHETPFAGVFAVVLTLPWSLLAIPLALVIPGLFDASLLPGTLVIVAAASANIRLLFLAGAKMDSHGSQ